MSDDAHGESLETPHETLKSWTSTYETMKPSTMASPPWEIGSTRPNGEETAPKPVAISVAVDPVALITTECITVTSAMRKHARWAHSSVSAILGGSSGSSSTPRSGSRPSTPGDDLVSRKGQKHRPFPVDDTDASLANRWGLRGKKGKSMQDHPLMAGFARLRLELRGCKGS